MKHYSLYALSKMVGIGYRTLRKWRERRSITPSTYAESAERYTIDDFMQACAVERQRFVSLQHHARTDYKAIRNKHIQR